MRRQILFATNNEHKLSEIRAILGSDFEVLSIADIDCHGELPETCDTLERNARQKARYIFDNYGIDCFADDTGLEVEALGGAPGVHTARYAYPDRNDTEANTAKLLSELKGERNRNARFRTVIALINGKGEHLFEGIVRGEITTEKRGTDGFGYDPVFAPYEIGKTFAEVGPEVKNNISHRARAVRKLCEYLKDANLKEL